MFEVKDDLTIYATRGDVVLLTVSADDNGANYRFMPGDVIRMKVFEKKDCKCVVMQKDFVVEEEGEYIDITLTEKDTRIGELISKPKAYWYEVELNPDTATQTIIGYDDNGAKVFMLMPEGKELAEYPPADVPTAIEVQAQLEKVEKELVPQAKTAAENAQAAAENAQAAAVSASAAAQTAQSYTVNPPKPLNGKWHLWDGKQYTESNEPSQGETGATGKSAYQYAQENGYIGTEEEYAQDVTPGYVETEVRIHSKRLDNIEAALYPDAVTPVADDSVAYIKYVPLNALPYAEVAKVGGMTYREDDALRSAPVTSIESVGANLFDEEWKEGYYISSGGADTEARTNICSANITPVEPNTTYIFAVNASININTKAVSFYVDGVFHSRQQKGFSFTTPDGVNGVRFAMDNSEGITFTASLIESAMLNKGTTALPYAPYIKTTLPIPEAVQALDGYGDGVDTACNYIDFERKQYIKCVGKVDIGTLVWSMSSLAAEGTGTFTAFLDVKTPINTAQRRTGFLCALYTPSPTVTIAGMENMTMWRRDNGQVCIRNDNYTSGEAFQSAMNGVMLYYELAEPEITDISHLLSDDNYIPVEGGGIITMQNEYGYAVPSTVEYTVKGASAQ